MIRPHILFSKAQKSLLLLLVLVTALQYSYWGLTTTIYDTTRATIIALIILVFILSDFKKMHQAINRNFTIRIFILSTLIFSIFYVFLYAFQSLPEHNNILRDIFISAILLLIGFSLRLSPESFNKLLVLFALLLSLSAFSVLYMTGTWFNIPEYYLEIPKNQIAPLYSLLIAALISLSNKKSKIGKFFIYTILALFFIYILVLRARSALVATVISSVIYLFFNSKLSIFHKILVIAIAGFALFLLQDTIFEVFTAGKQNLDIDTISSGRLERNKEAFSYIESHLFSGSWGLDKYPGKQVHFFLLSTLVDWGILVSIPILLIYFHIAKLSTLQIFSKKKSNVDYAPYMTLILIIVSMFEYSYPFSPASATYPAYLSLALYMRAQSPSNKQQTK